MHLTIRIAIFNLLVLICAPAISAQLYHVIDLGTLGGKESTAFDINNSGQIVGVSIPAASILDRAFLYDNGSMQNLGTVPGGTAGDSGAYAINNAGQIAGYSANQSSGAHAFLSTGGSLVDLGTLGGSNNPLQSYAYDINDSGTVVGLSYTLNTGSPHAFRYANGVMSDLGRLPGMPGDSLASSINSVGQIVGNSVFSTASAFLISNGAVTSLGTLGGNQSSAESINDLGQIVGSALIAGNARQHAVLWQDGTKTDLGVLTGFNQSRAYDINNIGYVVGTSWLGSQSRAFIDDGQNMLDLNLQLDSSGTGWLLENATAINDNGWIVGSGFHGAGNERAFLLVPVPEPSALVLGLLGLVGLCWLRLTKQTRH